MEVDTKFGVQENVGASIMFRVNGYLGPHAFYSSQRYINIGRDKGSARSVSTPN
jgi:hypothetical protein